MIDRPEGPVYAYAGNDGGISHYRVYGSTEDIGQFKAFFMGLPSVVSHWLFIAVLVMLPLVFFAPVIRRGLLRARKPKSPRSRPRLSLWHRCVSVLLAYMMLVGPFGFEQLAQGSTQYSQLGKSSWGTGNRIIEYGCWSGTTGGIGRTGAFTLGYDDNGSVTKKITWDDKGTAEPADDQMLEEVSYEYNLLNRLSKVTTIDHQTSTTTVAAYKYNADGVRVQKIDDPDGTPATTDYLIDAYNHTGYAQVLEESTATSLKTYTIGDDVLTQATDSGAAQHLLYDGHGSTRQLVSGTVDSMTIHDDFSYDGYGVLLQDEDSFKPTGSQEPGHTPTQATSLLYAGEQFDTDMQQYYLRARWYDQQNGRFNRMDPFAGNRQDPLSLHKYLYCHNNPVNSIDPSGREYTLVGTLGTLSIGQIVFAAFALTYVASPGVRDAVEDMVEREIKLLIAIAVAAGMTLKQLLDAIKDISWTRTKTHKKDVYWHFGFAEEAPLFANGMWAGSCVTTDVYPTGWHAKWFLALYNRGPRNAVYIVWTDAVVTAGEPVPFRADTYIPGLILPGGGTQHTIPTGTEPGSVVGSYPIPTGSLSDVQ